MKVLTEDCGLVQKIRRIEEYLRKENVEITHRADGLLLMVNDKTFVILDGETLNLERQFPSFCDGTKIQTIEHFINGT